MKDILYVVLFVIIVIGTIIGVAELVNSTQCSNYAEITKKNTLYKVFDTCYVEHEGKMYRYSEYREYILGKSLTLKNPELLDKTL